MLIASNHEWKSRSLESLLAPQGYQVVKTYTRTQALQQMGLRPDAVIIDEDLDADGHTLCRELHATARQTPVFLALTHPLTQRDRLLALKAGAWAAWGDPLDGAELLATLAVFVPTAPKGVP